MGAVVDRFNKGCTVPVGFANAPKPPKPVVVVGAPKDGAADTTGAANEEAPKPLRPPVAGWEAPKVGSAGVKPNAGADDVAGVPNAEVGAAAPKVVFAGVLKT